MDAILLIRLIHEKNLFHCSKENIKNPSQFSFAKHQKIFLQSFLINNNLDEKYSLFLIFLNL